MELFYSDYDAHYILPLSSQEESCETPPTASIGIHVRGITQGRNKARPDVENTFLHPQSISLLCTPG